MDEKEVAKQLIRFAKLLNAQEPTPRDIKEYFKALDKAAESLKDATVHILDAEEIADRTGAKQSLWTITQFESELVDVQRKLKRLKGFPLIED
jgi:hypothetical protein